MIRVIKIGEQVCGGIGKRPIKFHLELTHDTLSKSLLTEVNRKRFIKWLNHVSSALDKQ